jgi:hypothetical protein
MGMTGPATLESTLPISNPWIWFPFAASVVLGIALLLVAIGKNKLIIWISDQPRWRILFDWGLAIASVATALCGSMQDPKEIVDNKFPEHFWWTGPAFVFCGIVQVWLLQITYFKNKYEREEQIAIEKLAKVIERNEERRQLIGEIVNEKAQRIRMARQNKSASGKSPTIEEVATALQPDRQIILNAIALHKALRGLIGKSGTLRVAIFFPSEDGKHLKLFFAFDGKNQNCITTPNNTHAKRFEIKDGNKCLAVHAALVAGLHVISDTKRLKKSDKDKFDFFDSKQKSTIKSIVAFGYTEDDAHHNAVIVADSDRSKAFKSDDEFCRMLGVEFEEFGTRLLFEADVHNLFS